MSGIGLSLIESWLRESHHLDGQVVTVGTPLARDIQSGIVDSRLAQPNSLFVALPGDQTDGHLFVEHAVQRGAVVALVAASKIDEVRRSVFGSVVLLPVDDPLESVQEIALRWRKQFPTLKRIAITGSNGKTSTKEMIASILSNVGETVYSRGNYNSDIGLPLELLRIRASHEFGVFEMGMNKSGEMRTLARLVDPDVALITNVGSAHVGILGSRERIAEEKRDAFSSFTGDQIAIVPAGSPFHELITREVHGTVLEYSAESAGVTRVELSGLGGAVITTTEGEISFSLAGQHMLENAYAAITVGRALGAPFDSIRAGIESVVPSFGRGEVIDGEITIIQDCYNANPESMRAAVALLEESASSGRRIAVLGSMKELGEETEAAHREVVQTAMSAKIDEIWLVGTEFVESVGPDAGERIHTFLDDEWEEVIEAVTTLIPGDIVLLKGSRSMALERLTPVIRRLASNGVGASL